MRVLLLTGLYHQKNMHEIKKNSKGWLDNAANSLQWSILNGLTSYPGIEIGLINIPFIGSYPRRYMRRYYNSCGNFYLLDSVYCVEVGFLNYAGLRMLSRFWGTIRSLFSEMGMRKQFLLVYSMNSPMLLAAVIVKKIMRKWVVGVVIPDLPEYMNTSRKLGFAKRVGKKLDSMFLKVLVRHIDTCIVLTKYMPHALGIPARKCLVVEGMFDPSRMLSVFSPWTGGVKNIVYTGSLVEKYGVLDLVRAFSRIKRENIRLEICGSGELEEEILKYMEDDSRIAFRGLVDQHQALRIQQNAFALVNPRGIEGEYTKYSFPSKIIEYFATGRPVVAYFLPGMPEEYRRHIYEINGAGEDAIYRTLLRLFDEDLLKLDEIGLGARELVIKEKNCAIQMKRIVDFMILHRNVAPIKI